MFVTAFVKRQLALPLLSGVFAFASSFAANANPTLLLEPKTGLVLQAEAPDQPWYPASLTKLMTAYLTFDAVKSGRLAWDTKVPLSEKARGQPATRIGLRSGIEINVDQAVRGLILRSANDFAMALAETVGGSEEAFAVLMNDTAKRLGMTRSHFVNPHGLPDPEQVTTARDMGILASAILRDFPDQSEMFSTPTVVIHRGTFHSQNDLLRTLRGADGMKTGFTCGAGYNVVASATRDGRRLIAVVLGETNRTARSAKATALIEAGFAGTAPTPDAAPTLAHAAANPVTLLSSPVKLAAMPLDPVDVTPIHDMTREARTRKCGNREGPPRARVKGTAPIAAAKQKTRPAAAVASPTSTGSID